MLEEDPSFITENVDEEEFLNYVPFIKDINMKNPTKQKTESTTIIKHNSENKLNKEIKNSDDLIRVVEVANDFIDLKKYEKMEIISKDGFSIIYKIEEKQTNYFYAAKISINIVRE